MPAVDLGSSAVKERQQEEAQTAPEVVQADTAILVYRRADDGAIVLTEDINAPVVVNRPPSADDVIQFAHVLIKDLTSQQIAAATTQAVIGNLQAMGQQAMQQQQAAPMTESVVRKLREEGLIK